jgi:hypothetical protein
MTETEHVSALGDLVRHKTPETILTFFKENERLWQVVRNEMKVRAKMPYVQTMENFEDKLFRHNGEPDNDFIEEVATQFIKRRQIAKKLVEGGRQNYKQMLDDSEAVLKALVSTDLQEYMEHLKSKKENQKETHVRQH